MSKHTPGPWSTKQILNRHYEISAGGYWIGRARGLENARLIAAAPLLLEALKALLEETEGCMCSSEGQARAAIAAAEGKS